MYLIDNDGDETRTDEAGLRRMARNNGILDTETCDIVDLIDTILDCFPDVTITQED